MSTNSMTIEIAINKKSNIYQPIDIYESSFACYNVAVPLTFKHIIFSN